MVKNPHCGKMKSRREENRRRIYNMKDVDRIEYRGVEKKRGSNEWSVRSSKKKDLISDENQQYRCTVNLSDQRSRSIYPL